MFFLRKFLAIWFLALGAFCTNDLNVQAAERSTPSSISQLGTIFENEIMPRENFSEAKFRLCLPGSKPVSGILVLVPGYNGDGRAMVEDPRWKALARKFNLALLGCSLKGGSYYEAAKGTGEALLEVCSNLAKQSNHQELENVPFVLWGHSAGGQFNYDFACWKPQRVAAFVVNKGAFYDGDPTGEVKNIPAIFFLGMKDSEGRINSITELYQNGREQGAFWALGPEPNAGHEQGRTAEVAEIFFEAALRQRLAPGSPYGLKSINANAGWLVESEKHLIEPVASSHLSANTAGWVPDESTAKALLSFIGK